MNSTIAIRGYSDDVVCVEGPSALRDEHSASEPATFLELSTGDVFRVEYDRGGVWRIGHHVVSGACSVAIEKVPEGEQDPNPYTDVATVTGPIKWIEAWGSWPAKPLRIREKLEERIAEMHDTDEALPRLWQALRSGSAR